MGRARHLFLVVALAACGRGEFVLPGAFAPDAGSVDRPPAVLEAVEITPAFVKIMRSTTVALTATARWSDGTRHDATFEAAWTSSDDNLVSVDHGTVRGHGFGKAVISAAYEGHTGTATVQVVGASTVAVAVEPARVALASGATTPLRAIALASDGTKQDVTLDAEWASLASDVAAAAQGGLVTGRAAGTAMITATFQDAVGASDVTVTAARLSKLDVEPSQATLAAGERLVLTAVARFEDGTTIRAPGGVLWTSSATANLTIDGAGLATGVAPGTATITATLGHVSGTATLTIAPAALTSLTVEPLTATLAPGQSRRFVATGTFADGRVSELTASAIWSAENDAIASASNARGREGEVTALGPGLTRISANFLGISASAQLTVSDSELAALAIVPATATVPAGRTARFSATATDTAGNLRDVTAAAFWSTDASAIAEVSNAPGASGLVTAHAAGSTTVKVALGALSAKAEVTVAGVELVGLAVDPTSAAVAAGNTQQFTATARWSDGTSADVTEAADWRIDDTRIAQVSNVAGSRGRVTTIRAGQTLVHAVYEGQDRSASVRVVTPELREVQVTPFVASVAVGEMQPFSATAVFTDGRTQDVTRQAQWTSSQPQVAALDQRGARGVTPGETIISATWASNTGTARLTVTDARVIAISLSPAVLELKVGQSAPVQANGIYSDGSTRPAAQASWVSSDAGVANAFVPGGPGPGGAPPGVRGVTGIGAGATIITVTSEGFSATLPVTVTAARPVSIQLTPSQIALPAGETVQLQAVAIFDDGTSLNVTPGAAWLSSSPQVAQVSTGGGPMPGAQAGVATAISPGNTVISAIWSGLTGATALRVTDATLLEVQVTPTRPAIAKGVTQPLTATAIWSDFTTRNVTNDATWTSSDAAVAAVTNGLGQRGRATALAPGTSTISAIFRGVSGSTLLTVTPAALRAVQVTPATPSLPVGLSVRFTATALMSDDTSRDVTGQATWTSSNEAVAPVSNAQQRGVASAISAGNTTISANYGGLAGSTTLVVNTSQLLSISVSVPPLRVGERAPLVAAGTWDDGVTRDVTALATWLSSAGSVATVSNADDSRGVATGVSAGSTRIDAHFQQTTGTATLVVSP